MLIIGRDLERLVLSRAVKAHAEGRVFLLDAGPSCSVNACSRVLAPPQ